VKPARVRGDRLERGGPVFVRRPLGRLDLLSVRDDDVERLLVYLVAGHAQPAGPEPLVFYQVLQPWFDLFC
jgi:hypothetical protein